MIKNFKQFLAESIVTDEEREFIAFIKEYGEDNIRVDVEKFIEEAKKAGFPEDALQNAREVYEDMPFRAKDGANVIGQPMKKGDKVLVKDKHNRETEVTVDSVSIAGGKVLVKFPGEQTPIAYDIFEVKRKPSKAIDESAQFPHEIKSEKFWKQILVGNDFALKILDTVMKRQKRFASDRQMEVLRRVEKGDKSPYNTKN